MPLTKLLQFGKKALEMLTKQVSTMVHYQASLETLGQHAWQRMPFDFQTLNIVTLAKPMQQNHMFFAM